MMLVDFQQIKLPDSPNYCLVCPTCSGKRKIASPTFNLPVDQLAQRWQIMIQKQPRVKLLHSIGYHHQYEQRSAVFRFPDIIDVTFTAIDDTHSTLSALSRSRYGYYDFGVNCKRLKNWLSRL